MTALDETLRTVALTLARFGSFAASAVLFGLVPVLLLVVRPALADAAGERWAAARARLADTLEDLVRAALVAATVATAVVLLLQATLVAQFGRGDVGGAEVEAVFETSFGTWHAFRFPLLAMLAVVLAGRVRSSALAGAGDGGSAPGAVWWAAWAAGAAGLLCTTSLSGHAAVATPRVAAVCNDVVHLAAGSAWFAGVVVLAAVLPRALGAVPAPERLVVLAPAVVAFSRVALVSIAVVAVTGTVNSFLHVGAPSDLVTTGYGRVLAVKIGLFVVVLGLGALNHLYVRRRLERSLRDGVSPGRARRVFRRAIAAELALALVVLGATGLLVGLARTKQAAVAPTEPPGGAAHGAPEPRTPIRSP